MIDSHMHINSLVSSNVLEEVYKIRNNSSIEAVLNVGMCIDSSVEAVNIAKRFSKFYAAVGYHPLHLDSLDLKYLYDLAQDKKVVAIGEVGIDFLNKDKLTQIKALIKQICIANELELPVIIHANNANKDVIEVFEKYVKPRYGCVFHCFQPEFDVLDYLIDNNYYASFAGKITYLNAKKSIEVLKNIPNELFLVETDSPHLSPEPVRNEINQSKNLGYIIEKVANVKNMSYEEVEEISSANTKRLFKKMK